MTSPIDDHKVKVGPMRKDGSRLVCMPARVPAATFQGLAPEAELRALIFWALDALHYEYRDHVSEGACEATAEQAFDMCINTIAGIIGDDYRPPGYPFRPDTWKPSIVEDEKP